MSLDPNTFPPHWTSHGPGLAQIYPSVHIPQLEQILAAFEALKGIIMSLTEDLATLTATIAEEFTEIAAKVDALEAQIAAGLDAQVELDALKAEVASGSETIAALNAAVENLSTAGDDAPFA